MTNPSTAELYDGAADTWVRTEPVLLSDYTARPFVLERAGELEGARVLDLGCGEGYVSRQLAARAPARLLSVDISSGMIDLARAAEAAAPLGIDYRVASATELDLEEEFDLVLAVFLFNYLSCDEMCAVLKKVHDHLAPGGRFLFTAPHPAFPFLDRPAEPPFFFDTEGLDYFSARDRQLEGRIWRRDGESVPVRCVHKPMDEYSRALEQAGFTKAPRVTELTVTAEHLELDPEFFGPLRGLPLHVAFEVTRARD
ncbi:MAG: class I SAM-dependent methyltransferase [Planctomycetes bacterium]|nr:class I SAM-dependent methyltransferase [Planctomycetota bacterium]